MPGKQHVGREVVEEMEPERQGELQGQSCFGLGMQTASGLRLHSVWTVCDQDLQKVMTLRRRV